jgi:hypothetical protein
MIRMQVQLTDEQARQLRQLAALRREPIARVARELIDEGLRHPSLIDRHELRQRFVAGAGTGHSGRSDVAARHDDYLEDAYRS